MSDEINPTRRDFLKTSLIAGSGLAVGHIPNIASDQHLISERRLWTQGKKLRAAFSTAGLDSNWNAQCREAAMLWGGLVGVDVIWFDAGYDSSIQRDQLETISEDSWDFVVIQPNMIDALTEPVSKLILTGIPIINIDSMLTSLPQARSMGILSFIAANNMYMSEMVALKLVEKMSGQGKIAHIGGTPTHSGAMGRKRGFYNIVERYPKIEVVVDQVANWNSEDAVGIISKIIDIHPDLKAIFADSDDMALAICNYLDRNKFAKHLVVSGIGGSISAVNAVLEGRLVATACNPIEQMQKVAILIGSQAARLGLEQARQEIPFYIPILGPIVYEDLANDFSVTDEPWNSGNYGMDTIPGMIWLKEYALL